MEIETGEVSWQLTNPRGGMIWSGLLLEGEMFQESRDFMPLAGEWHMDLNFREVSGAYTDYWTGT